MSAGLVGGATGLASPAAALPAAAAARSAAATAAAATAATSLAGYIPLLPVRICDTRAAGPGVVANQCDTAGHTPMSTGGIVTVTVAGVAGVPVDATAVVLHVTATATQANSYLTVWPTGQTRPTAASVNWAPGQTVANLVATGIGTGGTISVFNYAFAVDVVIDLEGYVRPATGGLFVPLAPLRICDTRVSAPSNQCNVGGSGALGAGQTGFLDVRTATGVPAGATAVVLNLTVTTTTAASYLDVFANGASVPLASSLNWAPGQTVANRVITAIGTGGLVDVFNAHGSTDVVIDLGGYFTTTAAGSGFFPVTPLRICDTRPAGPGVPANPCDSNGFGTVGPNSGFALTGVGSTITAVVLNVTVTNTTANGFLTVFPDDASVIPLASDLNFTPHATVGNLVMADAGTTAAFDLFNGSSGNTDIIVDVVGFFSTSVTGMKAQSPHVDLAPSGIRKLTGKRLSSH